MVGTLNLMLLLATFLHMLLTSVLYTLFTLIYTIFSTFTAVALAIRWSAAHTLLHDRKNDIRGVFCKLLKIAFYLAVHTTLHLVIKIP